MHFSIPMLYNNNNNSVSLRQATVKGPAKLHPQHSRTMPSSSSLVQGTVQCPVRCSAMANNEQCCVYAWSILQPPPGALSWSVLFYVDSLPPPKSHHSPTLSNHLCPRHQNHKFNYSAWNTGNTLLHFTCTRPGQLNTLIIYLSIHPHSNPLSLSLPDMQMESCP